MSIPLVRLLDDVASKRNVAPAGWCVNVLPDNSQQLETVTFHHWWLMVHENMFAQQRTLINENPKNIIATNLIGKTGLKNIIDNIFL